MYALQMVFGLSLYLAPDHFYALQISSFVSCSVDYAGLVHRDLDKLGCTEVLKLDVL